MLAVGIYSILAKYKFVSLLSSVSYPLTSYLLVGAGVLVLIASVVGCCGFRNSDRCYLLVYILLLLLVFLLEAKAGILAFIYREQAFNDLQTHLNTTFVDTYGIDEVKTEAINDMQREVGHVYTYNIYIYIYIYYTLTKMTIFTGLFPRWIEFFKLNGLHCMYWIVQMLWLCIVRGLEIQ